MRLVLIGGGGHASDVLAAFEEIHTLVGTAHPVIGWVDDELVDERRFAGRGVGSLGTVDQLGEIDATHYLLAVGWPATRERLLSRLQGSSLTPATLVHPGASVHRSVQVGAGSVVLGGAHLSPNSSVGAHVLVSYAALVGHDCEVQDLVSVMPGAAVSGDTVLERACIIGTNATVIEGVRVGAGATLGAGAVAVADIPPGVTAVGVPARWPA